MGVGKGVEILGVGKGVEILGVGKGVEILGVGEGVTNKFLFDQHQLFWLSTPHCYFSRPVSVRLTPTL